MSWPACAVPSLAMDMNAHSESLRCGKEISKAVGKDGSVYSVAFKDGEETGAVRLLPLGEKFPESVGHLKSTSDPTNMQDAQCALEWKKPGADDDEDKDCEDGSSTFARLEGTKVWAFSMGKMLKQFGNAYSTDGSNKTSKHEDLERLANSAKDASSASTSIGELRIPGARGGGAGKIPRSRASAHGEAEDGRGQLVVGFFERLA